MKKIADHIPLITVVLVIFGYINQQIYYNYFGITLIHYLSPSEILLSFLPLVEISIRIIFPMAAFLLLFVLLTGRKANSTEEIIELSSRDDNLKTSIAELISKSTYNGKWYFVPLKFLFVLFRISVQLFILITSIGGIIFPIWTVLTKSPLLYELFGLIIFWWVFGLTYLFRYIGNQWLSRLNIQAKAFFYQHGFLIALFIMILSSGILSEFKRAIQLLHHIEEEKISFEYNNRVIRSSPDTLYLGRTEQVLFMRKPSMKAVLIYPVSEIKELMIRPNDSLLIEK